MKVLALNGSLRGARGATGKILQSMGAGVERAGGIWNVVHLSELKIETCCACNHCQRTKTYKCIFDGKDDTEEIFNKMRDTDILTHILFLMLNTMRRYFLKQLYPAEKLQTSI
jgi:multimeric flavodoxin WrbA